MHRNLCCALLMPLLPHLLKRAIVHRRKDRTECGALRPNQLPPLLSHAPVDRDSGQRRVRYMHTTLSPALNLGAFQQASVMQPEVHM